MNAQLDAARRYLDVRYSESERPYTDYPKKLTAHLTREYLQQHRGGTLLDLGCGRGEFLHGFAQLGFRARGFDRSRPSTPRFHEPVVVGDYEQGGLPFADGEFSVIFNKSVFEHVREITPLLQACHRVLAPGGRLVSLVPDWTAQWRHFFDDWTHVRPFTLIGLRQCIQSHGFEIKQAVRFRQLPLLWEHPYLSPLSTAASMLPSAFKRSSFVRFSKEWMLLVVADRVG